MATRREVTTPRHRSARPRYGRMAWAAGAMTVTVTAVLGAAGILPTASGPPPAEAHTNPQAVVPAPPADTTSRGSVDRSEEDPPSATESYKPFEPALPADSGEGRRVVFDMGDQRVWLVGRGDRVLRTYLVSGSLTDNLRPGTYEVWSRSRHAVGIDDSGTMEYMVRFAHGERAAIGFHDIPVDDGDLVQTRDDLGTPQSHGCIRQWRPDARALWDFAALGTSVVVTP